VGLDLVQPFVVQSYNLGRAENQCIPSFGHDRTLGALIGNTGFFWSHFLQHLAQEPGVLDLEHPLDTYVTKQLKKIVANIDTPTEIRFSYEKGDRFVALQTVCEISGLAPMRTGMLNIHPVYGPWIALRAILSFDLNAATLEETPLPALPTEWEEACSLAFKDACDAAGEILSHQDIKDDWERWLKVRDTCPIGKEHRYCEEQVLYHYTQDPEILRAAVKALS